MSGCRLLGATLSLVGATLGWEGAAITPSQRSRVHCLPDPFAQLVLMLWTPGEWGLNVDLFKVSLLWSSCFGRLEKRSGLLIPVLDTAKAIS